MSSTNSSNPLRIGMYGGGTVGGGVYELIMNNPANAGKIVVSQICVRDLTKARDFAVDESLTTLTTDIQAMMTEAVDKFDCIVEVMGGTGLAKQVVESALRQGKPVVTANKALLAEHWSSLQELIQANPGAALHWEAAVCGGIPIVQLLQSSYTSSDQIASIRGICNGTTNYMLTKMATEAADYADVLQEAQDLGYAEADPTADVEGHDVRAKIALLAGVGFGVPVPAVDQIPCRGISQITAADFGYAQNQLNSTIKLLGTAESADKKLSVYVTPAMVKQSVHSIAGCGNVGNVVAVTSKNLGTCSYSGPGAGRYPTANSVVADIYRVAAGVQSSSSSSSSSSSTLELDSNYAASQFYVRVPLQDGCTLPLAEIGGLADGQGVPISSVLQSGSADFCLITGPSDYNSMVGLTDKIAAASFCAGTPIFMPILEE